MRSKMPVKTKSKPSGKVQTPQGEQLPNYRKKIFNSLEKNQAKFRYCEDRQFSSTANSI